MLKKWLLVYFPVVALCLAGCESSADQAAGPVDTRVAANPGETAEPVVALTEAPVQADTIPSPSAPLAAPPSPTETPASINGAVEVSDPATMSTGIALNCAQMPEAFRAYTDPEAGIGFCYPEGWVVDNLLELSGFLAVSATGLGLETDLLDLDALILVYPHTSVTAVAPSADEAMALAAMFVSDVVAVHSASEPRTTRVGDQEQVSLTAQGTAADEPVLSLLSVYQRGEAVGMAIAYVMDEEAQRETAEAILASVTVRLPQFGVAGERIPLPLNSFVEGQWQQGAAAQLSLEAEPEEPILLVAQTLNDGNVVDVFEVEIYGPEGTFSSQFSTGWLGGDSWQCDPITMSECVSRFEFGYHPPDAVLLLPRQAGEHTIRIDGWDESGAFRLGALDMRSGAPMVVQTAQGELTPSQPADYAVEGKADQPLMAYVRPAGPDAEDVTLSLALLDAAGEEMDERHNYAQGGEPVFLYWVPRDDSQYTVRLSEIDGRMAAFDLTILSDTTAGRAALRATSPAYADRFAATIVVQESGDLLVTEQITLTFKSNDVTQLERPILLTGISGISEIGVAEMGRPYREATSGEAETFQVVEQGNRLMLRWFFAGSTNESRSFQIRYSVLGGVQVGNAEVDIDVGVTRLGSTVTWQVIPPDRAFAIAQADVHLRLPYEADLFRVHATGAQGMATAAGESLPGSTTVSDALNFTLSRDLPPEKAMTITVVYAPLE